MKVNSPGLYLGCIIVEYKGNNLSLLHSREGYYIKKIKLDKSRKLADDHFEKACFELSVYNKVLLIVLDGCRIYEVIKINDIKTYKLDTDSYIHGFNNLKCLNQFVVSTVLQYYHKVTETDVRSEKFSITLLMKNNKEINELLFEEF